jgi:hypothetical protein
MNVFAEQIAADGAESCARSERFDPEYGNAISRDGHFFPNRVVHNRPNSERTPPVGGE